MNTLNNSRHRWTVIQPNGGYRTVWFDDAGLSNTVAATRRTTGSKTHGALFRGSFDRGRSHVAATRIPPFSGPGDDCCSLCFHHQRCKERRRKWQMAPVPNRC
jgi:hypothetical protein